MSALQGKNIILGITGGIAAYKSVYLLRALVKAGAQVQVVITPNGRQFITPVTLSALSGRPVVSEFFSANTGEWHSHVDLGLWADAMVIAPATASTLAKMATGVADNMLVTTYLSAKCPVFAAPAMDLDMMAHPSTQRNLRTLAADGVHIIEAAAGELASHLTGKGRMQEPDEIVRVLDDFFSTAADMAGRRVLITAGPTHEPIDPVRYIGNSSTGKMGMAIADAAAARGAQVTVIAGPGCVRPSNPQVQVIDVVTARQMLEQAQRIFADTDIAVMAAAVADYAPAEYIDHKVKRESADGLTELKLVKNPDIAATLGAAKRPGQTLVGFALETAPADGAGLANAVDKIRRKNLDMIVLNSLADKGAGFGTDTNKVTVITADGTATPFDLKPKSAVATDILNLIVSYKF